MAPSLGWQTNNQSQQKVVKKPGKRGAGGESRIPDSSRKELAGPHISSVKCKTHSHLSKNGQGNDGPLLVKYARRDNRGQDETCSSKCKTSCETVTPADAVQQARGEEQDRQLHDTSNKEHQEDVAAKLRGVQSNSEVGHAKGEPAEAHQEKAAQLAWKGQKREERRRGG